MDSQFQIFFGIIVHVGTAAEAFQNIDYMSYAIPGRTKESMTKIEESAIEVLYNGGHEVKRFFLNQVPLGTRDGIDIWMFYKSCCLIFDSF